jgi:hypothetical protein
MIESWRVPDFQLFEMMFLPSTGAGQATAVTAH